VDVNGRGRIVGLIVVSVLIGGCVTGPTPSPSQTAGLASPTPGSTSSPRPSPSAKPDPASGTAACKPEDHPEWSVARGWDEALLDAIRRALPNPPVHARNLFHLSVAMWDAWAVYDPQATGYLTTEKVVAANLK
jgi:hypothetical protein